MTPMQVEGKSIEEATNFLSRVYGDLSVADDFVGITVEEIVRQKAREAIASVLLYTKGRMPEKKDEEYPDPWQETEFHDTSTEYNTAIDDCHAVLDEEIQEAKKLSE